MKIKTLKDLIIFKGKNYKLIHTMDITLSHIISVFFPRTFYEKYSYLGSIVHEESSLFKTILPIVIIMDYEAKPKWCPRWFLRFLHLFGNDNSIVRVRNYYLHRLYTKLTKGIFFYDYKTKWEWYDLRISVASPEYIQTLVSAIESKYYNDGVEKDLIEEILSLDPNANPIRGSIKMLKEELEKLKNNLN